MDPILKHKSDTFEAFKKLANVLQNQKGYPIVSFRSDDIGEFENNDCVEFCEKNRINHNFLVLRTP